MLLDWLFTKLKGCCLIIMLLLFAMLISAWTATTPAPEVTSISDGDTLWLRQNTETLTVRLGCIDAPEKTQTPWGQQSATRLKQLLPVGQIVEMRVIDRDRYNRTVGELFVNGQSVNLTMVREGQAVVYRQYLSGCAATKNQYLEAEAQAKAQHLGFWNQPNPVIPSDFRQTVVHSSPTVTADLPDCTKTDCDCKDFSTQAEAQRVLNTFSNDPYRLDRDGNGKACEGLP